MILLLFYDFVISCCSLEFNLVLSLFYTVILTNYILRFVFLFLFLTQ